MLEFALINAEYNDFYPLAVGTSARPDDQVKAVALSQFFVASGRMFELCVYLTNADKLDRDKLKSKAREVADQWRSTIKIDP